MQIFLNTPVFNAAIDGDYRRNFVTPFGLKKNKNSARTIDGWNKFDDAHKLFYTTSESDRWTDRNPINPISSI